VWLYGYEKELCTKTKARGQIGNSVEGASKFCWFFAYINKYIVSCQLAEIDLFDHHDHACTYLDLMVTLRYSGWM
jgi:hypothetical protein